MRVSIRNYLVDLLLEECTPLLDQFHSLLHDLHQVRGQLLARVW
jgi:hypothetical protein